MVMPVTPEADSRQAHGQSAETKFNGIECLKHVFLRLEVDSTLHERASFILQNEDLLHLGVLLVSSKVCFLQCSETRAHMCS